MLFNFHVPPLNGHSKWSSNKAAGRSTARGIMSAKSVDAGELVSRQLSSAERGVPSGYVAAKLATENEVGGHFQRPSQGLDFDGEDRRQIPHNRLPTISPIGGA